MKKALFIYPHNFLLKDMGTNVRVYNIAAYLKEKGFQIDLFAMKNFCSVFPENIYENSDDIVTNFYLYDFNKIRINLRMEKALRFIKKITIERLGCKLNAELQNWVDTGLKSIFKDILQNQYDYIVMFYLYTGKLLDDIEIKAKKINFMEDFLSIVHYNDEPNHNVGASINSEVKMCHNFDEIAFISFDEKIFFEKLLPSTTKCYFIPHIMQPRNRNITGEHTVDVLFIGHDNTYNINGMKWFFTNVYPFIESDIMIHIGGNICKHIPDGYTNVKKLGFVENIEELYNQTKVSICPLLNGTGLKIKVAEAMNCGIPVVCTSRGVDGLPDKTRNGCLVTDDPKEFAAHINRLCRDEQFRLQCAHETSAYVDACLHYDKISKSLNQIFDI